MGWALAVASFSGCGEDRGPERVVVSGTVAHNGKPISDGAIFFRPLPTCPVPISGANIVDGKYRVDAKGGVPAGTHKIQIEAFRKVMIHLKPGEPTPPMFSKDGVRQQYLPNRYNADSQLEITIPPGSRAITKNVDLAD